MPENKHLKDDPLLPAALCWIGGKKNLKKTILKHIPEHNTYVEPFMGAGSIFFGKHLVEKNIVNDVDPELMRFYRHLRDSFCSTIQRCSLPKNVKEFKKAVSQKGKSSCAYLGVNKKSYGCKMGAPNFVPNPGNTGKRFKESCGKYSDKLKKARILNEDYRSVVKRFDSKSTFHYLDPPYVDTWAYGQEPVNPEDVCKVAKSVKGKVILSYNDHPRVRKACKGLNFKKVQTTYEMQKSQTGQGKKVSELLISNFHLNGGNGHLKD